MTIHSPAGLSPALDAALQSLQAASEGDSLCTLRGDRVEAAKYYEGRVVALKSLIARSSRISLPELAAELSDSWQRQYADHAARDFGWASYLEGLLDACREVASSR